MFFILFIYLFIVVGVITCVYVCLSVVLLYLYVTWLQDKFPLGDNKLKLN